MSMLYPDGSLEEGDNVRDYSLSGKEIYTPEEFLSGEAAKQEDAKHITFRDVVELLPWYDGKHIRFD